MYERWMTYYDFAWNAGLCTSLCGFSIIWSWSRNTRRGWGTEIYYSLSRNSKIRLRACLDVETNWNPLNIIYHTFFGCNQSSLLFYGIAWYLMAFCTILITSIVCTINWMTLNHLNEAFSFFLSFCNCLSTHLDHRILKFWYIQVYWLQFGRYFARGPIVSC